MGCEQKMPFALSGGPGDAAAQLIAHLQCVGMLEPDCNENFVPMRAQRTNGCKEASEKGMHAVAWREACDQAIRLQTRRVYCCQCLLFMPRIHNCLAKSTPPRRLCGSCVGEGCPGTASSNECAPLSEPPPSPPVLPPTSS